MSNAPEEVQFRSLDDTSLWARRVRVDAPRARVAFVHGFAEHGGRYAHTLAAFAQAGLDAWVLDLRGHGQSGGPRTFVRAWSDYCDDVEAYLRHIEGASASAGAAAASPAPRTPLFLVGHSMGGLVVASALLTRRGRLPALAGAGLLSPLLGVKMKLPGWKVAAANGLSRLIPSFRLPSDIDPDVLSRDPAVGKAYLADSMCVHSATARWFTECNAAQLRAHEGAARLGVDPPLLVMHGDDDRLVDVEATRRFAARAPGVSLRVWPGGRHELLNETNQAEVRGAILAWMDERLASLASTPTAPAASHAAVKTP